MEKCATACRVPLTAEGTSTAAFSQREERRARVLERRSLARQVIGSVDAVRNLESWKTRDETG